MPGKITHYRDDATGQLGDPHVLGTTEDGRRLFQFVEGWTPVDSDGSPVDVECDESGNWIEPEADWATATDQRIAQINAIIEGLGLADDVGEIGGLIASFDAESGRIVIEDEGHDQSFPPDVTDEEVRTYLADFLAD